MITSQVSLLRFSSYHCFEDARQEELDAVVARHDEEIGRGQQQHLGMAQRLAARVMCRPALVQRLLPLQLRLQRLALVGLEPARLPGRSVRKNRTRTPRTTAGMPQAMYTHCQPSRPRTAG